MFPDFLRRAIVAADTEITDYNVRQIGDSRFQISFDSERAANRGEVEKAIVAAISARFRSLGGGAVHFDFVPMPARRVLQKRRRVMRDCPLPEHLS